MSYRKQRKARAGIKKMEMYDESQSYAKSLADKNYNTQYFHNEESRGVMNKRGSLVMPSDLAEGHCNTSLFGSFGYSYGNEPSLSTYSHSSQYSSPFSSLYSILNEDSVPSSLENNSIPVWNFAILPKDRTNYSSSCSSCAESQSSNEYDN